MICEKCGRVMLRCEEEIMVDVLISFGIPGVIGHALENSYRRHACRIYKIKK